MNKELPVQEAFPDLSDDDRERMLTGICPQCWDILAEEFYDGAVGSESPE
jgi:hypothetical protein